MPIQHHKSVVYNGHRGTVTTTFELVTRDNPSWAANGITPGNITFGSLIREGRQSETWDNPYTGEQETVTYQAIAAAHQGVDLDNAYLKVSWKFVPHADERIYPSDMAEEMRRKGWDEDTIQELLEWEQTIRNDTEE